MARPLRIEYPFAVYHVTSRGNEKKPIFKYDSDRELFLNILDQTVKRHHWLCHAYCLMDNHYHLLIETPDANLSIGMRQVNGIYTQAFNKVHKRTGHLFQGRYHAILIQKDSHLLEVSRYVVLNSVRAGITSVPERYRWSSYAATAGLRDKHACLSTGWILGQFHDSKRQAEKRYRAFVKEGIGDRIWEGLRGQSLFGEDGFVEQLKPYLREKADTDEIPKAQRYVDRPDLKKLFKTGMNITKRTETIVDAVMNYGYSQKEIADMLGLHYSTISRLVKKHHLQE